MFGVRKKRHRLSFCEVAIKLCGTSSGDHIISCMNGKGEGHIHGEIGILEVVERGLIKESFK